MHARLLHLSSVGFALAAVALTAGAWMLASSTAPAWKVLPATRKFVVTSSPTRSEDGKRWIVEGELTAGKTRTPCTVEVGVAAGQRETQDIAMQIVADTCPKTGIYPVPAR